MTQSTKAVPADVDGSEGQRHRRGSGASHGAISRSWRWPRWAPMSLSAVAYGAIAVFGWWHAWGSDPSRFALSGGGDQAASMWFLSWPAYTLLHPHNPLLSALGNSPYGVNMLVNTSTLPLGYLMAPVTLLAGPVVSYNLICTSAPVLSALAAYVLVRNFTSWQPAAFFGGLLYGFSPYVVAQGVGHIHLEFVALLPLIFLLLYDIVVRQEGRPLRKGVLLGLLVTVQFFISSELLVDTVTLSVVAIVVVMVLGRARIGTQAKFALVGLIGAAVTAAVLLAYPIWVQVAGPGHVVGPLQATPEVYRADLLGSIVPDNLERFAPSSLARVANQFAGNGVENGSYLGLPLVTFLVLATVVLRRSRVVLVAALMAAVALIMSLGSPLKVDNRVIGAAHLPEAIFNKLPLVKNVIPVRFSVFVALFAAIVFAVALDRFHASGRWRSMATLSSVAPLVVGAAVLVPLVPAWPYPMQDVGVPTYFTARAVDAIPANSAVLVYPFPDATFANPQVWQASAGLRFAMPGGRFNVAEPGTSLEGASRSSLTDTVLTTLASGVSPGENVTLRSAVDSQLRSWHVRTIVAAPSDGADPTQAVAYLTWLLGQAPTQSDGVTVWYDWR
jgi:hypothetical protein